MNTGIINEEWRTTDGYINYQVSNLGRVRNITTGRIMKLMIDSSTGYHKLNRSEKTQIKRRAHVLVARELVDNPRENKYVDHIYRNRLSNIASNLRWVTHQQNLMNQTKRTTPTSSRYKGVCFDKRSQKWLAYIQKDGKVKNLGYFDNQEDAARASNAKASEIFGEYASLNEISESED